MTDDQMVEAWLNEFDADTTRRAYARDLASFRDWLGTRPLTSVTRVDAAAYAAHVRRGPGRGGRPLAEATRARRLSAVSSFYGYLVESGVVTESPFYKLRRPKVDRGGRTPARTDADLTAMWAACPPGLDRVVVGLLAVSAMRVSELCRAQAKNLGADRGVRVLTIRTKGGGRRNVPVPPGVLADIDAYLAGRSTGPLVQDEDGKALTRDRVAVILRRAARNSSVEDPTLVRPHVLRASAITTMLEAGIPIQDVQEMVGHASADTTRRYWRRRAGILRDAELAAGLEARYTSSEALPETSSAR